MGGSTSAGTKQARMREEMNDLENSAQAQLEAKLRNKPYWKNGAFDMKRVIAPFSKSSRYVTGLSASAMAIRVDTLVQGIVQGACGAWIRALNNLDRLKVEIAAFMGNAAIDEIRVLDIPMHIPISVITPHVAYANNRVPATLVLVLQMRMTYDTQSFRLNEIYDQRNQAQRLYTVAHGAVYFRNLDVDLFDLLVQQGNLAYDHVLRMATSCDLVDGKLIRRRDRQEVDIDGNLQNEGQTGKDT